MAHIGPAVRELRQRAGLSVLALANQVEVDAGYLSRLEREQAGYTPETEQKLAEALGLSVARLHELIPESAAEPMAGFRRVPLIELEEARAAGDEPPCFSEAALRAAVPSELELSRYSFAVRICDNMMSPAFLEGDLILVDPTVPPRAGDFVVARNGTGEMVFNRFRIAGSDPDGNPIYELIPANPFYPTWRSDQHSLQVVGVMMEHRVPRRRH